MNLVEAIGILGGIKECDHVCDSCRYATGGKPSGERCERCVQFELWSPRGELLDLAPLLAKPKELAEPVKALLCQIHNTESAPASSWAKSGGHKVLKDTVYMDPPHVDIVVGPQRAHSLVYEVARQLGGTAVVAEPKYGIKEVLTKEEPVDLQVDFDRGYSIVQVGHRLSREIPSGTTILLVTDRWDTKEMSSIYTTTMQGPNRFAFLPYILCLVSNEKHFDSLVILSLHQENA